MPRATNSRIPLDSQISSCSVNVIANILVMKDAFSSYHHGDPRYGYVSPCHPPNPVRHSDVFIVGIALKQRHPRVHAVQNVIAVPTQIRPTCPWHARIRRPDAQLRITRTTVPARWCANMRIDKYCGIGIIVPLGLPSRTPLGMGDDMANTRLLPPEPAEGAGKFYCEGRVRDSR